MIEVPLNFKLDTNGVLLQDLVEDGPMIIMDMALEATGQRWAAPIEGCAELIVPHKNTIEDEYKHQAFFVAGIIACHAFSLSDAPENMIKGTFKHMTLAQMPVSVLSFPSPLTGLEEVAREGHAKHREFKDHMDFVMEYYCSTTQQPYMSRIAFCGAGVTLFQLERAWEKARDGQIEAVALRETQSINWDSLPWTETSGD